MEKRHAVLVFPFLLLLVGCSKAKSTPTLAPFISGTVPVLNPVSSNFEIVDCSSFNGQQPDQANPTADQTNPPPDDNSNSDNLQCGYLSVPEDRRTQNGTTLKIAVTIFLSSSPTRQPVPLIYIGSGSGFGRGRYFDQRGMDDQMVSDRDLIQFDIRGTGRSEPAYNCQGYSDLSDKMTSGNLSLEQWKEGYIDATRACHDQLKAAGANLSTFTSSTIAADMEDLRQALGYSQWNVYASSAGTRIALALMRDFPQSLRSVVLDSPWPLQVDPFAEQALHAEQVLNTLFQYCAEDEQCNQHYPLLKDYFYDDIDTLNSRPITVHTTILTSGAQMDIVEDGNQLLNFVLSTISSSRLESIYEIPRTIYQLHDSKVDVLSQLLGQSSGFNRYSEGVEQLILCSDEAGSSSLDAIDRSISQVDIGLQGYFKIYSEANWNACEAWNPENLTVKKNEAVISDVPTLLLASDLNWQMPVSWADLTAQTLRHSYIVKFLGTGQTSGFSRDRSGCSNDIVKAFLNEPGVQPDSKCAAEKPHFIWITIP